MDCLTFFDCAMLLADSAGTVMAFHSVDGTFTPLGLKIILGYAPSRNVELSARTAPHVMQTEAIAEIFCITGW